jgi:hypothetical protein
MHIISQNVNYNIAEGLHGVGGRDDFVLPKIGGKSNGKPESHASGDNDERRTKLNVSSVIGWQIVAPVSCCWRNEIAGCLRQGAHCFSEGFRRVEHGFGLKMSRT